MTLGGAAIGIGLYYTWRRITIAEEDLKATKEGQITERFTRAVDQLGATDQSGNSAIEIRLGGIYALERIANESEKDHWPIMEILTAYVRKNGSLSFLMGNTIFNSRPHWIFGDYYEETHTKQRRAINVDLPKVGSENR